MRIIEVSVSLELNTTIREFLIRPLFKEKMAL